jgi:F420-non-reducing hydrogenase large subunit
VSKRISEEERQQIEEIAKRNVAFARLSLKVFADIVLENKGYVDLITSDAYTSRTYYMGMVDDNNKVNFYDGKVRVVDPDGREFVKYSPKEYLENVAEHVESWSYTKFPFLKKVGWKGFVDGRDSGVYRATPLSRLNAADGMATPLAQAEYEKMYSTLGGKPVHFTLATHWARLIELLYAAERLLELATDREITGPNIRNIPVGKPTEGVGIVEAPRGTLTHHYTADEKGRIKKCNLIVGTTNNQAALFISVKKAAEALIKPGKDIPEALLNQIEMAWRPYDPCMSCSTHTMPGRLPLEVTVLGPDGSITKTLAR